MSGLADEDMCSALAPHVETVLYRRPDASAALRAKAILARSRCWQLCPAVGDDDTRRIDRLRHLLAERDLAVLAATLGAIGMHGKPLRQRAGSDASAGVAVGGGGVARKLLPELIVAQRRLLEAATPSSRARGDAMAWVQLRTIGLIGAALAPVRHCRAPWMDPAPWYPSKDAAVALDRVLVKQSRVGFFFSW